MVNEDSENLSNANENSSSEEGSEDVSNTNEDNSDAQVIQAAAALEASQLADLKALADSKGIKYHPNIKAATLRTKIADDQPEHVTSSLESRAATNALEAAEANKQVADKTITSLHQTVRVRVQCMVQAKKDYDGEYFTVANSKLGSITKYVHFGTPWHIPEFLLDVLKEKKNQVFTEKKGPNGTKGKKGKSVSAYSVEILPDLTQEELDELKAQQIVSDGRVNDHL